MAKVCARQCLEKCSEMEKKIYQSYRNLPLSGKDRNLVEEEISDMHRLVEFLEKNSSEKSPAYVVGAIRAFNQYRELVSALDNYKPGKSKLTLPVNARIDERIQLYEYFAN